MICSYPYRDQDAFTQDVESEAMIKIYGMPTCPYCDFIHEQVKGREDEFEYINIGEHIRNLSAFMRLRDTDPVFDHLKAVGDVGVPAFVFEDGAMHDKASVFHEQDRIKQILHFVYLVGSYQQCLPL